MKKVWQRVSASKKSGSVFPAPYTPSWYWHRVWNHGV